MRVVDQQIHMIVLSQLREAAGHDGIHGYSWTTMRCAVDGRKRNDPPNRAVKAAKASGRYPISRAILIRSHIISTENDVVVCQWSNGYMCVYV